MNSRPNIRKGSGTMEGEVALVTGGGRGIGAAIVGELASAGATVVWTDLHESAADTLPPEFGANVHYHKLDVRLEHDWLTTLAFCENRFGKTTVVVNNAGISAPGANEGPLTALPLEAYRRIIETNQIGRFLGIKHGGDAIAKAGGGAIVNVSSIGAILGVPYTAAYASAKAAGLALTRVAATELGARGVRVNAVLPGAIRTPIHQDGLPANDAAKRIAQLEDAVRHIPLPRFAEPEEVARLVVFLASKDASYITSSAIAVDGGMTAI